MKITLNELKIEKFRGATRGINLGFEKHKPFTLIYAENGNGKSTISDALICLLTKGWGSIEDKSIPLSEYSSAICSINHKPNDVHISLSTNEGTIIGKFNGKEFNDNSDKNIKVSHLKRSQLSKLIDAKPADRYKEIAGFLDLDNIINSEIELKKLHDSLEGDLKDVSNKIIENESSLIDFYTNSGKKESNWEIWTKSIMALNIDDQIKREKELSHFINKFKELMSSREINANAFNERKNHEIKLEEINMKLRLHNDSEITSSLVILLQKTIEYLDANTNIEVCPVCKKSEFDDIKIKADLQNELNGLKDIDALNKDLSLCKKKLDEALNYENKMYDNSILQFHNLSNLIANINNKDLTINYEKLLNEVNATENKIGKLKIIFQKEGSLDSLVNSIESEKNELSKIIHNTEEIKAAYNRFVTNTNKSKETEDLFKNAKQALEIVRKSRIEYTDKILMNISENVNELYSIIHPGEAIGDLKMFLNEKQRNSLFLTASFYGKDDISPQALYSESHLDTLGICIFLALAKMENADRTIVILDDVISSVDENHLDRFIELLHSQVDSFAHLLVTTHYRPWKDKYKYGRAQRDKIQFVELRNWNIEEGIQLREIKTDVQELKHFLLPNNFDRQIVASKSGILAESLLYFINLKYRCKLQVKEEPAYSLGELIYGISPKLKSMLKSELFFEDENKNLVLINKVEFFPILKKLKDFIKIRNIAGAHFNQFSSLLPDKDIIDLGLITIELAEALYCPLSGQLPIKNSGSYWKSNKGGIRLYPLEEPRDN